MAAVPSTQSSAPEGAHDKDSKQPTPEAKLKCLRLILADLRKHGDLAAPQVEAVATDIAATEQEVQQQKPLEARLKAATTKRDKAQAAKEEAEKALREAQATVEAAQQALVKATEGSDRQSCCEQFCRVACRRTWRNWNWPLRRLRTGCVSLGVASANGRSRVGNRNLSLSLRAVPSARRRLGRPGG